MSPEKRPDMRGVQYESAFEAAIAWLDWLDHRPDDADARAAFARWRDASVEHREASARAMRSWRALGEVARHPVVTAWRDQAPKGRAPRRPWLAIAAALVLMVGGYAVLSYRDGALTPPEVAQSGFQSGTEDTDVRLATTALGERQHLVLSDGTKLTLNTASRVEIDYRGERRQVRLVEGEAIFAVAKDPSRPFVVTAADRQVVALGTSFGVRVEGPAVQVTLLEGRVAVKSARAAGEDGKTRQEIIELEPGQQLIAEPAEPAVIRKADVLRATSWQDGWIILNRDTVRDAIDEVNRYTRERITYDDARIDTLRVSGTFRTGEVEDFLDALAKVHPLAIERLSAQEAHLVWHE